MTSPWFETIEPGQWLPTVDMTELLIGNANHIIFAVDQSITSCRAGLDFQSGLKQLGVPMADSLLLVDHYLQLLF